MNIIWKLRNWLMKLKNCIRLLKERTMSCSKAKSFTMKKFRKLNKKERKTSNSLRKFRKSIGKNFRRLTNTTPSKKKSNLFTSKSSREKPIRPMWNNWKWKLKRYDRITQPFTTKKNKTSKPIITKCISRRSCLTIKLPF